MKSRLVFLCLLIFSFAACNDYYSRRAKERAEHLKKSDSLLKELQRMEDTTHIQTIVGDDTINTYKLKH